jgi:hypothetical protein
MTYEHFNKKVDERKALIIKNRQKRSLMKLIHILGPVSIALILISILEAIGFISNVFCIALMTTILCYGFFCLGRVWNKIKF